MNSSPLSSPSSAYEDSIFGSSVSEDSILGLGTSSGNEDTKLYDNVNLNGSNVTQPSLDTQLDNAIEEFDVTNKFGIKIEGSSATRRSSEGESTEKAIFEISDDEEQLGDSSEEAVLEISDDEEQLGELNGPCATQPSETKSENFDVTKKLDINVEGSSATQPSSEGESTEKAVLEISDDEEQPVPAKKRRRITEPTAEDDSDIEYIDPRDKFCIRWAGAIGPIMNPCGDPQCPRGGCLISDACTLYIYLPLMFRSEPIVWMVPVERNRGGRLRLSGLTHLLHIASADRIIYLTWRIGLGWINFNWNEWQVLPGEDVILRPKHEEIGENRPGMKEVMQRLYASMLHEGWTCDRVPDRFL